MVTKGKKDWIIIDKETGLSKSSLDPDINTNRQIDKYSLPHTHTHAVTPTLPSPSPNTYMHSGTHHLFLSSGEGGR